MKRNYWIIIIVIIVLIAVLWYAFKGKATSENIITVPVKKGEFIVSVTTTGELEAKNSVKIYGPTGLRKLRVYKVKVNDLIPEGTIVDSGDYVAQLDKSEVLDKLKDLENEVEKAKSQYIKTKLDTTLQMRKLRDNLQDLEYTIREKKIEVEQSKFEPPATQRQTKIALEKAKRNLEQAKRNYKLELKKAEANMQEVLVNLSQKERKLANTKKVLDDFTIYAPQPGMVIYERTWEGTIKTGSTINVWMNVVATLPDLSKMVSKTYVNEIDISKVEKGQEVEIEIDAFPGKTLSGTVTDVANIGQKMRNTNTKVFEVKIEVNETDSVIRPAMTTKNEIITETFDDVIHIPIESIFTKDSVNYVFVKNNGRIKKQQVITGASNENEIIVKKGLDSDEHVCIAMPSNADNLKLQKLQKEEE